MHSTSSQFGRPVGGAVLALLGAFLIGCQAGGGGNGNNNGNDNTNDNVVPDDNENDNGGVVPGGDGVCGGEICGPSGDFSVDSFPNIAGVDFDAFPDNPPRPYQPANGGRTWFVAPGGDDSADGTQDAPLASPEEAVARATTGDVILVADGDYTVGSEEYNALTLSVPGVTLAAENIGGVTLRPPAGTDIVASGIAAVADDLVVDGFVLTDFRSTGILFGRLDSPQQNLVLKHLVIDAAGENGLLAEVTDVSPNPTPIIEGLRLYDVWLRNIPGVGFNCGQGPCNDVRMEALRVDMVDAGGGSGFDAVGFENGDNIVVFNAEVTGSAADGLDFKCTRVAIANVIVHDLARNGIKLWHGGDVINAMVYNTDADAAVVVKVGRFRLLNSLVAYHALEGEAYTATIGYDDPTEPGQTEVINTILYQNTGPVWVSSARDLDMRNSIIFNSPFAAFAWGDDLYVSDDGDTFADLEAAGGGSDNLGIVDPRLVDPQAGDFTLAADSPGLDAGTSNVEEFVSFDLQGNARVAGAAVDLGPIESQ